MLLQPETKEKDFLGFKKRPGISFGHDDIEDWKDANSKILDNLQHPYVPPLTIANHLIAMKRKRKMATPAKPPKSKSGRKISTKSN